MELVAVTYKVDFTILVGEKPVRNMKLDIVRNRGIFNQLSNDQELKRG